MIITGVITSFYSEKTYSNGIINTTIVAIFYSILFGLIAGLDTFGGAIIILVIFGIVGSLIGNFIQKSIIGIVNVLRKCMELNMKV